MLKLWLQMFADGEGGADGTAAAAPTAGSENTGVKAGFDVDAAVKEYRESRKPRGKSFDVSKHQAKAEAVAVPTQEQAPAAEKAQEAPVRPAFKDLIKGDYKAEADEYIQQTIQDRLKKSKEMEKTFRSLQPALDALAESRGLQPGDYDTLASAILNDASLYEAEALRQGVPVETVMQISQLQRQAEESQAKLQQIEAETQAAQYVTELVRQGEELKQRYPNFDLRQEMQEPKFRDLVTGPAQMSLEDAYWVIHRNDLMRQTATQVSQQTKADVSRSIQSGALRPMESAARPGGQTPQVTLDPRNLTSEQIRDFKERARRGEKISFG